MNLRSSVLALLALTMIPSGMALTSSESASQQQEIAALYKQLNLKKAKPAPEKPLTTWEKIKQKLAWFNVNRVLGITGIVLLGWMLKRQFFSEDAKGGNLNPFVPKKKKLKFKNGYRNNLNAAPAADIAPVVIQGPGGKEIAIEQIAVVPQVGPSCPYHSSVNAEILARAEMDEKNRDAQRQHAKNPQYVGQRIEAAAEHIEKMINGDEQPTIEVLKAEGVIPGLQRSTSEKGWAEASIVHEILAQNNAGHAEVVSFQDGVPQHNEALLQQNGVHRVVVAYQGENNVAMGEHGIHYFTVVINRQNNKVRYVIADSLGNADRRRARAVTRLISHLEQNESSNEGVQRVHNAITHAIRNPGAAAPIHRAHPAPAAPINEFHEKELGANNPPPVAPAPKPAAKPAEPKPGDGGAAASTASATPAPAG